LMQFPDDTDSTIEELKAGTKLPNKNKWHHLVIKRGKLRLVSHRRVMTIGDAEASAGYKFSGQTSTTISWDKELLLKPLKEMADLLSKKYGVEFNRVHLNKYNVKKDEKLAWHADDDTDQHPIIVCLSWGAPQRIKFQPSTKPKKGEADFEQKKAIQKELQDNMLQNEVMARPYSAYVMTGNTQAYYHHSAWNITNSQAKKLSNAESKVELRLSATFRAVIKTVKKEEETA